MPLQLKPFFPLALLCALCFMQITCNRDNRSPEPVGPTGAAAQEESAPRAGSAADMASEGEQPFGMDLFSSSAARPGAIDSIKKFIRTAEMRFRVNNVATATLQIEDIASRNNGFVVKSDLNAQTEYQRIEPVSRDSAVETTAYSMHNQITIRVPYRQLDTTLRSIGRLCAFLNYRRINAEDVGLQLLEQELGRIRQDLYRTELGQAPDSTRSKGMDKTERMLRSRGATDQARIEILKLEDAILFSTIRIDIYQLPQVQQTMIANTDLPEVKIPFFRSLGSAFATGADILEFLVLGLVRLWGVGLLLVIAFWLWSKWPLFRKIK